MPSTVSLIQRLKDDFPQVAFAPGAEYMWSPDDQTVYYAENADSPAFLLHELSHGLLGHADYERDIELVAMERAAWDKALGLSTEYNVTITDELVENALDSYRDWLHARSTCPRCEATGVQIKKQVYSCPACSNTWRVNEARICALRRYSEH